MFSTIYTGLSGLIGFSKDLDVIGNNITNLNTPGFKSSTLHFQDLFYQYQTAGEGNTQGTMLQIGTGVEAYKTTQLFKQGNFSGTGNPLDVGIDGNGFFIIRNDDRVLYTRSGQFTLDGDGYLTDQSGAGRVAGSNSDQQLYDISIRGRHTSPPVATSKVTFSGNLLPASGEFNLTDVTIYDSGGNLQTLKVKFTDNSATTVGSWLVTVTDANDVVVASGEIRYQANGSPAADYNTFTFDLARPGLDADHVTFVFGDVGSFSGTTNLPIGDTSTLSVASKDGYGVGLLSDVSIDETGHLVLSYSNGQKDQSERIALAWFDDLQALRPVGGNMFEEVAAQTRQVSGPGDGVMGMLALEQVELSNVDLTQEFTNIIIAQRGYQASSQLLSVTNEMIQQLFDIKSGR